LKPVVLQLIDSFNQGGSERQALQLTRLLRASDRYQVRLASLSPDGVLRKEAEALDLGEIPSFPLTSFYDRNALTQLRRLAAFLRAARVDILHTHDFYTNLFGMSAGKFTRVPVRIASMRETAGMRTGAQQRAQGLAYRLAHQVVANSLSVRNVLEEQGVSAEKISVIYNGLNLDRVAVDVRVTRPESFSLLGLNPEMDGDFRFVTIVANMRHEVKNYPLFLRAAQQVSAAIPNVAFLLAGEGELMGSLQTLAKELGIGERTFFLGRCAEVSHLLRISDVCVLSSKAEGFSNSILEYMAAGKPVVATAVGGAPEVIIEGETGYIVPPDDERAMADRIISLLNDPKRASAMGLKGRAIVEQKFSCDAQLKRTEALYEQLLVSTTSR
jgi:glycosyltransferase involved in cell wall biosynthesis